MFVVNRRFAQEAIRNQVPSESINKRLSPLSSLFQWESFLATCSSTQYPWKL
jgi:hypothetical protein